MNLSAQLRQMARQMERLADVYDQSVTGHRTPSTPPPSDPALSIARNALWDTWTRDREARFKSSWQRAPGRPKPWTKDGFCDHHNLDRHDLRKFLRGELSPRSKTSLKIEAALKVRPDVSLGNKNDVPLPTANGSAIVSGHAP